jgi:hypothetical protein
MLPRATRKNVPFSPPQNPSPTSSPSRILSPAEELSEEERLDRLCVSLLQIPDPTGITTDDLSTLCDRLHNSLPILFKTSDFVLAREFLSLVDLIQKELRSRSRLSSSKPIPPNPAGRKRLDSFDSTTKAGLKRIGARHRRLRDNFAELWESRMKPRYFAPNARLRELRQQAIELEEKGNTSELVSVIEAAENEEVQAAKLAQFQFQQDYEDCCSRLNRRRDLEVNAFIRERRQRRDILSRTPTRCQSQTVSRVTTPRGSRLPAIARV